MYGEKRIIDSMKNWKATSFNDENIQIATRAIKMKILVCGHEFDMTKIESSLIESCHVCPYIYP